MRLSRRFSCVAVLTFLLAIALPLSDSAARQAPAVRTAAEQFKNLKVLRDIPANQITPTMHLIGGQLGVGCQFCHTWGQWDRDDKPQKETARAMMAMTASLNRSMFGGEQRVNCYTCHRGSPNPATVVALPVPTPPLFDAPEPLPPTLPQLDEILRKYVSALGGEQAIRKITTRVITGTREVPSGPGGLIPKPAKVEIYQKAPNLLLNVARTDAFTISDGFDGTTAWAQNVAGAVNELPNPDQARVRRTASLYEPLELKRNYSRLEVTGFEKIGPRDAVVVTGFSDADMPERLYFDTKTGLLLRRAMSLQTAAGPSPYELTFDDYRDSGGVKIPFLVRMTPATQRAELGTSSTLRIDRVQNGVAIDEARFRRPQPRPPAGARGGGAAQ